MRELKNAVERAVIMSRGDKIKAVDIMPRHLRRGADPTASIRVPPGATLADTRRQLVLRAFASTNGDYARTANMVGMAPGDVRAEIAFLAQRKRCGRGLSGTANGAQRAGRPAESQPAPKVREARFEGREAQKAVTNRETGMDEYDYYDADPYAAERALRDRRAQ